MLRVFKKLSTLVLLTCGVAYASPNSKPCQDQGQIYAFCHDQSQIYNSALASAMKHNKLLLVEIGAVWCPFCQTLHRDLKAANLANVMTNFNVVSISVTGKKFSDKEPSGIAVVKKLAQLANAKNIRQWGIPMLAVVNPQTKKVVMLKTGPLEIKGSASHDPVKVAAALNGAMAATK